MALTPAERAKRYRNKLKLNSEKYEELRRKQIERVKRGQKKIQELSETEKSEKRKVWREQKKKQREAKKQVQQAKSAVTPTNSSLKMAKHCIVRGCKTGSTSDRKNRKKNNIRQASLFRVPKCKILREKWIKALAQEVAENQFVCEKHFRDKDIHKAERLVIHGTEFIVPRKRCSLINDKVIPINQWDKETKISEEQVPISNPKNDEFSMETPYHLDSSSEISSVNDVLIPQLESEDFTSQGIKSELPVFSDVNDASSPLLNEKKIPTFEEVYSYLSSILIKQWCNCSTNEELMFFHVNLLSRKEDRRFYIDKNLSVKVSFSQRPEFPVDVTISSINDVKEFIKKLQTTVLCKGTGMLQKKFAAKCTGKISLDRYKRWRQHPRCFECRNLRHRIQIAEYNNARVSKKHNTQKHIKKRCRRLSLKFDIEGKRLRYSHPRLFTGAKTVRRVPFSTGLLSDILSEHNYFNDQDDRVVDDTMLVIGKADYQTDSDEAPSVQLNDYEDLTLYDDGNIKNEPDKEFDGIHEGFCCNICEGPIQKFRYTCIQCKDFDMCSGCEMKGMHSLHYVLRIPAPKPFGEIQEIVTQIREYVMNINKEITIKELETRSRSNSPESHQNDDPLHFGEETNSEMEYEYLDIEESEEEMSDFLNDSFEKQDTSPDNLTVEERSCDISTRGNQNPDDALIGKQLDINSQFMKKAVNQIIQIDLGPSKANVNSDIKRKHQDSSYSVIPSKRAQPAVQLQRKTIPVHKVLSSNQVAILMQNQQTKVLTKVPHKVNLLKKVVLPPQMLSKRVNINQNPTLDNMLKCLQNDKNK